MERHSSGNPFIERTPLKNMASSALVPEHAKGDLLQLQRNVTNRTSFKDFVMEGWMKTSPASVWDSTKKLKPKSYSRLTEKCRITVSQKVCVERRACTVWQIFDNTWMQTRVGGYNLQL
jgi:hypothetical protein